MKSKHPTVGKKALAEKYFLKRVESEDPEKITEDSPIPEVTAAKTTYQRFKGQK
jgi:hypothetical protein